MQVRSCSSFDFFAGSSVAPVVLEVTTVEVVAFIGPTGTGKSHRASKVAHDCGADVIIDDGLLIKYNKIIAGTSAKY